MMASRKAVLDKNKQQLLDSVNASNKVYNTEELSILISEQADKIVKLEEKITNLETENRMMKNEVSTVLIPKLDGVKTDFSNLNGFVNNRFLPYVRSDKDYTQSCGIMGNSAGMRTFIQESWNSYPDGISFRQMNSYGCNYMVIINKSSNSYGTIILTGYENQYSALLIGSHWEQNWRWSRTNMTNF